MRHLRVLVLSLVALAACRPQSPTPASASAPVVAAPTPVPAAQEEGCAVDTSHALDTATTSTDSTGATITAVGGKLSGVPAVKVADLLAKAQDWAGKTVRLEGSVSAMCTHRRAWFAVQGEAAGSYVRVLTAPAFLVPEGSIGRKARTEGVVEIAEVAPSTARHYAEEHKLDQPAANADAPVRNLVLRATGAEFF